MLQRVVFGPLHEPHADHETSHDHSAADHVGATVRPIGWHEIAGLAPLMALIVLIGVYPQPIFDRIAPATRTIAAGFPDMEPAAAKSVVSAGSHSPGGPPDPSRSPSMAKLEQDRAR
jgi:NADH-quinone oxidoreductase subunit M